MWNYERFDGAFLRKFLDRSNDMFNGLASLPTLGLAGELELMGGNDKVILSLPGVTPSRTWLNRVLKSKYLVPRKFVSMKLLFL